MLMRRFTLLTALLLLSTPLMAAHHGSDHSNAMEGHSSIEVAQPWTRATPPGAGAGGGFVTLTNHGDGDDMLLGATSPITERVEIHIMEMDGDVMRMVPLPSGIELPAGESVTLPSTLIFDHPTARSLAIFLQPRGNAPAHLADLALDGVGVLGPLICLRLEHGP